LKVGAENRAKVKASGRRIPTSAEKTARGRSGTKERRFKVKPPSSVRCVSFSTSLIRRSLSKELTEYDEDQANVTDGEEGFLPFDIENLGNRSVDSTDCYLT